MCNKKREFAVNTTNDKPTSSMVASQSEWSESFYVEIHRTYQVPLRTKLITVVSPLDIVLTSWCQERALAVAMFGFQLLHKYQYHLTVKIFTLKNCANYTITNIWPVFFSCPLRGSIPQAHVSPIRNHVLANFLPCASTLRSSQPTSSELNQTTERELGGQGWGFLKGSMLQQSF